MPVATATRKSATGAWKIRCLDLILRFLLGIRGFLCPQNLGPVKGSLD